MTNQEAFTIMKDHLLSQGERCTDEWGNCLYRHDGKKCAVGALIPDKWYSEVMENTSVKELSEFRGVRFLSKLNPEMLEWIQCVHDDIEPEQWEERLQEMTQHYNLKF